MNNRYQELDSGTLDRKAEEIRKAWKGYLEEIKDYYRQNHSLSQIEITDEVDDFALKEMICRVNARKDYFERYHDGMEMSEYKEIGLKMFWIVKFQPFRLRAQSMRENGEYGDTLTQDADLGFKCNENFAVYYMLSALEQFQRINFPELSFEAQKLSGQFIDELVYSLKVRDISKEAMGLIVELVAKVVIKELPS